MFLNIVFDYKMIIISVIAVIFFGIVGFISDTISLKKSNKEKKETKTLKLEKKPLIKEREKLEKLPEEKIFDDESGFGKYERLPEDDIFKI